MDWILAFSSLGIGGVIGALIGAFGQARTSRASDERRADQERISREHQVQQELTAREHADKIRAEERMYEVATQFAKTAKEVASSAVDIDGIFNSVRDWALNDADMRDPNVVSKTEFATRRVKDVKRLAEGVGDLQLVAPPTIIAAAQNVFLTAQAQAQGMTETLMEPVLTKALGGAITDFVAAFRAETAQEEYTATHAQEAAVSLMQKMEADVAAFMSEYQAEARRRGIPVPPAF